MEVSVLKEPWHIENKTVLVTGGNAGIGKATSLALAKAGARVILGCRNVELGERAAKEIRGVVGLSEDQAGKRRVYCGPKLDLSSFESVRTFAEEFLKIESELHVLIENAGIWAPQTRQITADGNEMTFQINHLGHFLLTKLLLPIMKGSAPGRIIIVASNSHKQPYSSFNFEDPQLEKPGAYSVFTAYGKSKLANVLFALALKSHLQGTGITAYSLHPGFVGTDIVRERNTTWGRFLNWAVHTFGMSVENGARTSVYCASQPGIEEHCGKYFVKCCPQRSMATFATDTEAAERLWELSEELVMNH